MKTPRIANAIGQIDDDLVAGAAKCKTKNKKHWLKWGSLAACFAVLVIAGAAILPSLFRENVTPEPGLHLCRPHQGEGAAAQQAERPDQ